MKLVFSHQNLLIVANIANLLEAQGVTCELKNRYVSGALGELPVFDSFPQVWVSDDDEEKANSFIADLGNEQTSDWICSCCGEENGAAFAACWNCEAVSVG